MNPLVSVIVPAYNHAKFIRSTLDSAVADGYLPIEILICDDGSSDDTRAVAEAWAYENPDANATVWAHVNAGLGATLNRLLERANGKYVVPIASDDELKPSGIAARLAALRDGTRAVFGDAEAINASGGVIWDSFLEHHGVNKRRLLRDPTAEIILNWAVPGPVLLAETDAIRDVGGYSEDVIVEDWDLYLRLAARGWLRYADVSVARYRIHGSGISWRPENWSRMVEDQRLVATRNLPLFRGKHRHMLRFQRLVYTPPWRTPLRAISKAFRVSDQLLSKLL